MLLWVTGVPGLLFRSTVSPQAAADTDDSTKAANADAPQTDGVREIIETIVFVVVLVLLLKSFAAEAFVIPTGSMAETLLGYQRVIKCPQCGLDFPVNCSNEVDPQQGAPTEVKGCVCPSCRYEINFDLEKHKAALAQEAKSQGDPDYKSIGDPDWKKPDWNSGDRVLVAKFLYELLNRQPNRLDVVVFKFPGESSPTSSYAVFPGTGPIKNHTPMNYIKRLIGLPGETIAIHRGKPLCSPAQLRHRIRRLEASADRRRAAHQAMAVALHPRQRSAGRETVPGREVHHHLCRFVKLHVYHECGVCQCMRKRCINNMCVKSLVPEIDDTHAPRASVL